MVDVLVVDVLVIDLLVIDLLVIDLLVIDLLVIDRGPDGIEIMVTILRRGHFALTD